MGDFRGSGPRATKRNRADRERQDPGETRGRQRGRIDTSVPRRCQRNPAHDFILYRAFPWSMCVHRVQTHCRSAHAWHTDIIFKTQLSPRRSNRLRKRTCGAKAAQVRLVRTPLRNLARSAEICPVIPTGSAQRRPLLWSFPSNPAVPSSIKVLRSLLLTNSLPSPSCRRPPSPSRRLFPRYPHARFQHLVLGAKCAQPRAHSSGVLNRLWASCVLRQATRCISPHFWFSTTLSKLWMECP